MIHRSIPLCVGLLGLAALFFLPGCSVGGSGSSIPNPFYRPSPRQVANDAFNVSDPDKRRNAVSLLSSSSFGHEPPYVRMYRLLLDDPDATVRAVAIKALGVHGDAGDVKAILRVVWPSETTQDAAPFVRWEAAKALQKLHDPVAVQVLIRAASSDEDADVRQAAAYALGQYKQREVFNALVGVLDDQDFGVVQGALSSLAFLTGYDFGADPSLWLLWAEKRQETIFEHAKPYVWQPYAAPPHWYEKAQFWRDDNVPPPKPAKGG